MLQCALNNEDDGKRRISTWKFVTTHTSKSTFLIGGRWKVSTDDVFSCFHPFLECVLEAVFYRGTKSCKWPEVLYVGEVWHFQCSSLVFAHTALEKRQSWITPTLVVTHVRLPTPPLETLCSRSGSTHEEFNSKTSKQAALTTWLTAV